MVVLMASLTGVVTCSDLFPSTVEHARLSILSTLLVALGTGLILIGLFSIGKLWTGITVSESRRDEKRRQIVEIFTQSGVSWGQCGH